MRQRATAQTAVSARGGLALEAQLIAFFASGAKGAMFSSAMAALDQDNAGTTPVSALGQTIGRRKDLSGLGNHAVQATAGARPLFSARKNFLIATEDFANAAWSLATAGTATQAAKTPLYGLAPDGTQTACRVQFNRGAGTTSGDAAWLTQAMPAALPGSVGAIWMKSNTGANQNVALEYTGAGTVVRTMTPTWQQFPSLAGNGGGLRVQTRGSGTYGGDLVLDFLVWHPQTTLGNSPDRYQRVNTATDYDTVGFPRLALFDGVDDVLAVTFAAALGSTCTVGRAVPGTGAVITTGVTIGTTFNDSATNAALLIADRALTAGETALWTAYLNQQLML